MFPTDTDFETKVTLEAESIPTEEETPFRALFLGDWSGRESRSLSFEPLDLHPIEIDRDNFDEVMKKLRVRLDLDFQGNGENTLPLEFTEIDDFHPDQIFQRLPLFANLRDIRKKLMNPNTFNQAAREVNSWLVNEKNEKTTEIKTSENSPAANQFSRGNLLEQILDKTDENSDVYDRQTADKSELSAFVSKLVKPHVVQTNAVEQSKLLLIVDEVTSDLMRKILHHPQFQALESSWRGIYFLVRQVETDVELKIYLLDISKGEIENNLKSVDNLTQSSLFKVIKSGIVGLSGYEPWAVLGGNYTFSLNIDDVAALVRIAKISDHTNIPFISYIEPQAFGFNSISLTDDSNTLIISENSNANKLWTTLRSLPEAAYLGLALPRFLARLPYGEQTEPTENFHFEEFSNSLHDEKYLWINPAFACILLIAQTYSKYGWDIIQNMLVDISGLPVHLYSEDNETKIKSCIEIVMKENDCEWVLSQGLMPLVSFLNTDRIKLGRFQSIADTSSILRGKWR